MPTIPVPARCTGDRLPCQAGGEECHPGLRSRYDRAPGCHRPPVPPPGCSQETERGVPAVMGWPATKTEILIGAKKPTPAVAREMCEAMNVCRINMRRSGYARLYEGLRKESYNLRNLVRYGLRTFLCYEFKASYVKKTRCELLNHDVLIDTFFCCFFKSKLTCIDFIR